MEVELKKDEQIEDLQCKGLKIIQNKKWFCFGIDSVLLANFVKTKKKNAKVIDLGAGSGVISILLSAKIDASNITCVEKQPEMCDILERNIKLNKLEKQLKVLNCDIIDIPKPESAKEAYDIVVTNPPYQQKGSGLENENEQKHIARTETTATLEDIIKKASEILKDKGQFFIVHKPNRIVDVITLMREHKLEPKNIRLLVPTSKGGEDSTILLVEGVKNGKPFARVSQRAYWDL